VFLNHLFGATTYRGGLFAGLATDNSRVGRSYAKFNLPQPPAGLDFRVGNIDAYCTGAATSGTQAVSVAVGCQAVSDTSWLGSSMVWTTPANLNLNAASAEATQTINYNPATLPNPAPGWTAWSMPNSLRSALANTAQPFGVAWAAPNEANAGWAYFAKTEYDPLRAPCATYALEVPIPIKITFSPNSLVGGGTVVVSVIINGVGLGDSAAATVTITHPDTTSVSGFAGGSMGITGLSHTFTLIVDTPPGSCEYVAGPPPSYIHHPGPGGGITITVVCGGVTGTATLSVGGYPAPTNCP
jgi:hypothetical protein